MSKKLSKRKLIKEAYTSIVINNWSHQQTFEELRKKSAITPNALAEEVAKIPSKTKAEKFKTIRNVYIVLLAIIIVLRLFGNYVLSLDNNIPFGILIFSIVIGLLLPGYGIFGALTSRVSSYRLVSVFFIVSLFRSISNRTFATDLTEFLVLIPFVLVIILGFYIPPKLKTSYKKVLKTKENDGLQEKSLHFVFENDEINDEELLDSNL